MSITYHLWLDEAAKGPFTIGQLRSMWNSGQITGETHYTSDAGESWHHLSDIVSELEPASIPPSFVKTAESFSQRNERRVETSGLAIASLIFAIIGIFPVAIIMGHGAKSSIKKNYPLTGNGLANAGLILGYIELCILAFVLLFFFGILGLISMDKKQRNVFTAISSPEDTQQSETKINPKAVISWNDIALDNPDGFMSIPWDSSMEVVKEKCAAMGYSLDEEKSKKSTKQNGWPTLEYSGGTFANVKVSNLVFVFGGSPTISNEFVWFWNCGSSDKLSTQEKNLIETALKTKFGDKQIFDENLRDGPFEEFQMSNGTYLMWDDMGWISFCQTE